MQHQDKPSRVELVARAAQEDGTPNELLTPERLKRKRDRERKRKQREDARKTKVASKTETEREWWAGNRATLEPEKLTELQAQDAYIRDVLFSMETLATEDDELVEIVVSLVNDFGVAHLGYITHADKEILPSDWPSQNYWQSPELLAALLVEGHNTETYIRYGLLVALPDWRVVQFLTKKAGWSWQKAADLVGYYVSLKINGHPTVNYQRLSEAKGLPEERSSGNTI
jgi:hypothetical protein